MKSLLFYLLNIFQNDLLISFSTTTVTSNYNQTTTKANATDSNHWTPLGLFLPFQSILYD